MSESVFGDLDIANASDNPFGVDPGVHPVIISDAKVGRNKNDDKTGLTLIYKITEGEAEGNTVQEWKTIKSDGEDVTSVQGKRNASFIKMRLNELGIPADRMNGLKPDADGKVGDLIGIEGFVVVGEPQGGYTNVKSFSKVRPGSTDVNAVQAEVDVNPWGN